MLDQRFLFFRRLYLAKRSERSMRSDHYAHVGEATARPRAAVVQRELVSSRVKHNGLFSVRLSRKGRTVASVAAFSLIVLMLPAGGISTAAIAPVGQGFVVTASDLNFILKQIKIAERHSQAFAGSAAAAAQPNPNPAADPNYCLAMIGSGADRIPDALTTYGLRTVDGACNNLSNVLSLTNTNDNHPSFGAADLPFPRLTSPVFRGAESSPPGFPAVNPNPTTYAQKTAGNIVYDTQPRTISNLIVDQTSTNPAAVAAARFPVRTQGNIGVRACDVDPLTGLDVQPLTPPGCIEQHHTLFIPNVTTDVGLSPPYNSMFTFFGQFFDHGVDQTVKSNGTVIVPLNADDPLVTLGPDGKPNTGDEVPPQLRFMAITRAQNQPGPDGTIGTADDVQDANNTDTPWVDQSQTYTSHSSHQAFLREYVLDTTAGLPGKPVSTGKFLGGLPAGQTYQGSPDGTTGISTWKSTKQQAATKLGLLLQDKDVTNIPMLLMDPYGNFIAGPARGLPQYVTASGLVEGNIAAPVPVPANVRYFDTPFLTDIAHNADPSPQDTDHNPGTPPVAPAPDGDLTPSANFAGQPAGTYDDEMLNAHFTCGDGRCNENIALSTIHQLFHSEHDRLAAEFDTTTLPANAALQADYKATNCATGCATNNAALPITFTYGQRLFQAARFVTEMEYQHLVFEEFARKVQPAVRLFHIYSPDINPAVRAEFAHAVYRFGHSMLNDDVARTNVDPSTNAKTDNSLPLLTAFLNPPEFFHNGGSFYTPEQAAGAVVMGSSDQVGNELDEFVTEVLRNNLLGLPLDLATLNLTRARSEGIPPLNGVRRQIHAATNDGQLAPYTSWADFGQHLKHPESLINFVAAYGTHPSITGASTLVGKRDAARAIIDPRPTDIQPADSAAFIFGTNYAGVTGVAAVPPTLAVNAVQQFAWASGSTPADFTLTYNANTTPTILAGAPIADIDTALDVAVGGLGVTVSGGPLASDGFVVTFNAAGPVSTLTASDANLVISNQVAGVVGGAGTPGVTAIAPADWRNVGGVTVTGLDSVDLWIGGLAEVTNLFGGLLGSTFNYVFQTQLEGLQDGDRFYYLARTPGMNLRTQLEGNSFSELIQRNTDNTFGLKADAFATADCKFQLANLTSPAAAGSGITGLGSINDDPSTPDCDENLLLLRQPDGTIQYRSVNRVDPPGINGQSVYNGTASTDRIYGGNDNDTFWGGAGNDVIEGNGGDDVALGGDGDDIITDLGGADVPKGGPGNDAIDAGIGDDIPMGGDGVDFINGGANDNETFAGRGDDFVIAGQGADAVFGDGGDDWIEGGTGQDLLIGDHGAPFFDDPGQTKPGHDVFVGQVGENDYDAEGGDDVMAQNAAVDRNAGAAGFDWAFHQYNTVAADDDMNINQQLVGVPIQLVVNRDRWQETEGDSGAQFNDIIRGISTPAAIVGGAGFSGCDALDNAGVDRIAGLRRLVNTFPTLLSAVVAASFSGFCPLTGSAPDGAAGTGVWAEGNILLGGGGSDLLEGRGNNDILDGDHMLRVRISVRSNPDGSGAELGSTDLMENQATSGSFGAGTTGMNLQQAVFAGLVNPGQLVAVRELVGPDGSAMGASAARSVVSDCGPIDPVTHIVNLSLTTNCDTALFSAAANLYTITTNADGSVTVAFNNALVGGKDDATDTLWNMENLRFCTASDPATKACTAFQDVSIGARIAVSAASLSFANQTLGSTSAARVITVSNSGATPIVVSGVSIAGTDATSFAQTNNCATIPQAGTCTVSVTFTPTSPAAAKAATLTIASNDVTRPSLPISLTGTGVAPTAVTFRPGPLSFANQALGTTSTAQTLSLVNTTNAAATATSLSVSGPNADQFVFQASRLFSIPPQILPQACAGAPRIALGGLFCNVNIRFAPTVASGPGVKTATLTFVTSLGTYTTTLTGTAVTMATIGTPANFTVTRTRVPNTSVTQLTVTNTGTGPLDLASATVTTGNAVFSATIGTCNVTVNPGGTCQIPITFTPNAPALTFTGTLTLTAPNTTNSPRVVNLTGRS
jgi:Ca2+-binding RTX toxin-like protein